jgi:acetoin:2,6-dichlorophenolindophenol oxidoreductase subunit alpha
VFSLPFPLICENNLYMEYTPIGSVTAVEHPAADRAPAYRLPSQVIDGNDVVVVAAAVALAADRARAGEGPTVIEAMTYRHFGHSRTDPATYRPAGELDAWLSRDPLDVATARLTSLGVPVSEIDAAADRAARAVAEAVAAAKSAPGPDPAEAFKDVWSDGGWAWRT